MEKEIRRFEAVSASGTVYTVVEYQRQIRFSGLQSSSTVGGSLSLRLDTGEDVNFIDDTTFEIVRTGEKLRKVG